jgi:hypothetical protein
MLLHGAEVLDPHVLGHLVQIAHGHRLELGNVNGVGCGFLIQRWDIRLVCESIFRLLRPLIAGRQIAACLSVGLFTICKVSAGLVSICLVAQSLFPIRLLPNS